MFDTYIGKVAPRVGAWIEIVGLFGHSGDAIVAPRVGAWIEIWRIYYAGQWLWVAPRVGAWIEIIITILACNVVRSLPVWERGLKF